MNPCSHGNIINLTTGQNCLLCMAVQAQIGDNGLPAGVREEFLERAMIFILRQSMHDANGDQPVGIAMALKRAWITGFKTGQDAPKPFH